MAFEKKLPPEWRCIYCGFAEYVVNEDWARALKRRADHESTCCVLPHIPDNTMQPCSVRGCACLAMPALYCSVHRPQAVLTRAKALVEQTFTRILSSCQPSQRNSLAYIEEQLLTSFDETV